MSDGTNWISVKDRLPDLDQIVIVKYPSVYDRSPLYAWGARVDDGDGWLWGIKSGGGPIHPDKDPSWNDIEAGDDYQVTDWQPLPR